MTEIKHVKSIHYRKEKSTTESNWKRSKHTLYKIILTLDVMRHIFAAYFPETFTSRM